MRRLGAKKTINRCVRGTVQNKLKRNERKSVQLRKPLCLPSSSGPWPWLPPLEGREWALAAALLSGMRHRGLDPNVVSYSAAISACERRCPWVSALGGPGATGGVSVARGARRSPEVVGIHRGFDRSAQEP